CEVTGQAALLEFQVQKTLSALQVLRHCDRHTRRWVRRLNAIAEANQHAPTKLRQGVILDRIVGAVRLGVRICKRDLSRVPGEYDTAWRERGDRRVGIRARVRAYGRD